MISRTQQHFSLAAHFRALHPDGGEEAAHPHTSPLDCLYIQADGLHSQLLLTKHGLASEKKGLALGVLWKSLSEKSQKRKIAACTHPPHTLMIQMHCLRNDWTSWIIIEWNWHLLLHDLTFRAVFSIIYRSPKPKGT